MEAEVRTYTIILHVLGWTCRAEWKQDGERRRSMALHKQEPLDGDNRGE